MRTTVEIKPEYRSALLALAARRGEKGFSGVLEEAIESFLEGGAEREHRLQKFLSVGGSLSKEEAAELRRATAGIRESWR